MCGESLRRVACKHDLPLKAAPDAQSILNHGSSFHYSKMTYYSLLIIVFIHLHSTGGQPKFVLVSARFSPDIYPFKLYIISIKIDFSLAHKYANGTEKRFNKCLECY